MFYKNIFMIIMKKDFFIFRHGQTNKNLENKWQGSGCDDVLNETGQKQAKNLADKVKDFGLEKIYCSPMKRARQTADYIVKSKKNLTVEIIPDLREVYFGMAEGLTFDEVRKIYGKDFEQQFFYPTLQTWDLHFPKGESKHNVFCRVNNCLKKMAQMPEKTIGVVCHAGVISALQCGYQLQNVCFDNCAVLHLQYDTESGKFEKIN